MEMKGIGFENFRVFKDYSEFELAPVTVLTGANSSGKTTIIKALKLLQTFWNQQGFGHHLDFDKGNHQLGDFEMCRSKNSDEKEVKIIYQVSNILFDSPVTVELCFQLDENRSLNDVSLKNGILKWMQIKLKKNFIYNMLIDGKNVFEGFNYKYIIQSLLPNMKETWLKLKSQNHTEFVEKKADIKEGQVVALGSRGLIISKNPKLYFQLQALDHIDFNKDYPDYQTGEFTDNIILSYEKYPFIYDLKTLDLFAQIPKSESVFFIDAFWKLLTHKYAEIEDKFSYATFMHFIEQEEENGNLHINSWKDAFLLSGCDNFEIFLTEQIHFAVDEMNKSVLSIPPNISDMIYYRIDRFYQATFFSSKGNTIWSYYKKKQSDQLTESQKAINICDEIISDAIFLENQLFNIKPVLQIEEVLDKLKIFLTNVCKEIEICSNKMYFIDSIRAYSQRFYSYDSQVSSFNSFITEFLRYKYTEKEESFLKKWLKEFEIAENCEIRLVEGAGCQIFLEKDKEKINLVDLGYGVTQFLPILLKIIYCNNIKMKTIVIEEPETNLHPKFQSQLVDLFMDAYKTFKINFIIETHSEYLIRKLQYLTAKGDIKPDDTLLYYMGNPNPTKREFGENQIIKIKIKKSGQLSQPFGSGFTDEASHWIKEMFIYSNLN